MKMDQQEFLNKYTKHLNAKQLEAVRTVDGAVLLLAVPEAGRRRYWSTVSVI